MSDDKIQWESFQEMILERLTALRLDFKTESETTSEVLDKNIASTLRGSGSATSIDSTINSQLYFVFEYFYHTFCDYFNSTPVFKQVGIDITAFTFALRFVFPNVSPLFPDIQDLPDTLEEFVSEVRGLGLQLFLDIDSSHKLKTKCFQKMNAIQQAFLDGPFQSSNDSTNHVKKLSDELTGIMRFLNRTMNNNRLKIRYFSVLRGRILSIFYQN